MPPPLNERSAISINECQKVTPYKGMPDVAPNRLHISRHYGSTLYRTPRTEDGRHVPAGLLAHGSSALLRPSQRAQRGTVSGICGVSLPLTVAEAAAASGPKTSPTA